MKGHLAAVVLAGLLLCACDGEMFETPRAPGNATLAEVRTRSDFFHPPDTARNLKFGIYGGLQGSQEFLYFEDSRENADQFARELIRSAPDDEAYEFNARPAAADAPWWPTQALQNSRGGGVLNDGMGRREVLIVDRDGYSQIWAFRASPA